MIRPLSSPIYAEGALAVLRGNLAPDGVVIKPSACAPHLLRHTDWRRWPWREPAPGAGGPRAPRHLQGVIGIGFSAWSPDLRDLPVPWGSRRRRWVLARTVEDHRLRCPPGRGGIPVCTTRAGGGGKAP